MKWIRRTIVLVLFVSLGFNMYLGYQALLLNRRATFSENILIDSNYILDKVLNTIDKKPYRKKLKKVIEEWPENTIFSGQNSKFLLEVPLIDQTKDFPNGCEAVSATMLLQHIGYDISPAAFIDEYLDKKDMKISWGVRYGPNPEEAYAGDPRSEDNGFGCFSPVIENALNKYVSEDYDVLNLTGYDLEEIEWLFIEEFVPVMIWATVDMQEITKFCQWQSFDKTETYLYPSVQHALVLVGMDKENYYFNDPMHGNEVTSYPKRVVKERYRQMGKQAIAITEKEFLQTILDKKGDIQVGREYEK